MPRPAIVIGMGGTGQWIVTLLKKNLMETYKEIPGTIKLLSFDTLSQSNAEAAGANAESEEIQVGGVSLDRGKEFISLTGNLRSFGQEIANGLHPHIASWFDARHYLEKANPSLWDLSAGAAQIRQFGRLAFFAKAQAVIASSVNRALEEVRAQLDSKDQIQLIVASSFAGGTGAGMFIDMGLLCRNLINEDHSGVFTRGFFILPSAFGAKSTGGSASTQYQLARSFAAWRELDRYMTVGSGFGLGKATYQPGVPSLDFDVSSPPYDVCYLVDSHRDAHSLDTVDPTEGVYPSVSNFVGFLLDEIAGRDYTELFEVNAGGAFAYLTDEARYSVFGNYRVKSPVYYVLEEYSVKSVKSLLDHWLVPAENKKQEIIGLISMMNAEVGEGISGKDEALNFLLRPTVEIPDAGEMKAKSIPNTQFMPRVAEVFRRRGQDNPDMIQRDADGGFSQSMDGGFDTASYIGVMAHLPIQDQDLQGSIERELAATEMIYAAVLPSAEFGDPTEEAIHRFELQIPAFFKEHFGGDQGGYTTGGRYGDMLNTCRTFHVNRYKEMLHQYMLNVLNGTSTDPRKARRGKLGFMYDALMGMVEYYDYFDGYLQKVQDERGQRGLINIARQEEGDTQVTMHAYAGQKRPVIGGDSKKALETQEQYLQAVDYRLTVIKDDMLLGAMRRTTEELRAAALQARDEVGRYIRLLVGDRNSDTENLYQEVHQRMDKVGATYKADKGFNQIQKALGLPAYSEVSHEEAIDEIMGRLSWKVDPVASGFGITLQITVPEDYEDENGDWKEREVTHNIRTDGMDPLAEIRKYFYELSVIQHKAFPVQHYVLDDLNAHPDFGNPVNIAKSAESYSNVLFAGRPSLDLSRIAKTFYIRALSSHNADADRYVKAVQSWLDQNDVQMRGVQGGIHLQSSEDPFVLDFVRAYANVPSTYFKRWTELRDAYLRHIQQMKKGDDDASKLHIFPAEHHATKYEQQITPLLRKPYRAFHPRVVSLLEYDSRLSLYFRCMAYGYFSEIEGDSFHGLELRVPEMDPYTLIPADEDGRESQPTVFEDITAFVISGKDRVTGIPLDWTAILNVVRKNERTLSNEGKLEEVLTVDLEKRIKGIEEEGERRMKIDRQNNPQSYSTQQDWGWHPGQDYKDLADLGRLMALGLLEANKRKSMY